MIFRNCYGLLFRIVAAILLTSLGSIAFSQAIQSFTTQPTSIVGGGFVTGTIAFRNHLQADVIVNINYGDFCSGPSSVLITTGNLSREFTFLTKPVAQIQNVVLTAHVNSDSSASNSIAHLSILPTPFTSFTISPATLVGGNYAVGTVLLGGPAPANGLSVTLTSSKTDAVILPSNVTVPPGSTSVSFDIATSGVTSAAKVSITAKIGTTSKPANLTVVPSTLSSLTINPSSVVGGTNATGTVTLTGAAPKGGSKISLTKF